MELLFELPVKMGYKKITQTGGKWWEKGHFPGWRRAASYFPSQIEKGKLFSSSA